MSFFVVTCIILGIVLGPLVLASMAADALIKIEDRYLDR